MTFNPNVHFEYGGCYLRGEEGLKWLTRNPSCAIPFKTSSAHEITYSALVDKILKKIAIVGANPQLKLSYIPLVNKPVIESYIFDDDDLHAYLTTLDKEGLRSVLHVEVIKGLEINERSDHLSRTEAVSSFGLNYDEPVANGNGDDDVQNSGMLIIYRAHAEGEEHRQPIIEEVISADVEKVVSGDGNENGENGACGESDGVHNHAENGLDGMHEFVDLPRSVEERQYVEEWEDGTGLVIGQEFCSKEALQDLVDRASNKNCFGFHTYKSDPGRLILECRQKSIGCKWYIRATKFKGSGFFTVRVYRKMHTCSRAAQSSSISRRRGTPRLVAYVLYEDYPGQFDTPAPKNIVGIVQRRVGLSVSYSTALRGKRLAVNDVRGTPEEGYLMLYSYLYMLEKVNPGTVTSVKLDRNDQFQYLFIALGASIEGFRSMRKVIVVDSTFLKTVYGGQLVFASAQDPNHHHYPIAFGVIDGENHASWNWFLGKLKTVIPDDHELVFMSDRHKSIIHAVANVYPKSQHGHCIWHLSQNVRGQVQHKVNKDLVAQKFIHCAHLYTVNEFEKEYDDFKKMFPSAHKYLVDSVDLDKWARCYFKGEKYNLDTSNTCESLNSVFKKERKLHLLPMIDAIVDKMAFWFNKHRKESASLPETKVVVPFVENMLHDRCPIATCLTVGELNSFQLEYSVIGNDRITYLVDLEKKSCSCRWLDIDKYPCVHAIAAVMAKIRKGGRRSNISIYDMCSKYYLIETWALAYHRTIYPVPHVSTWSIPEDILKLYALPFDYDKTKGRNQEERYPSTGESRKKKKKTSNKSQRNIDLGKWFKPVHSSGT